MLLIIDLKEIKDLGGGINKTSGNVTLFSNKHSLLFAVVVRRDRALSFMDELGIHTIGANFWNDFPVLQIL